jgi:hypothetical protein
MKRRIRWRIVGAAAGLAFVVPLASDTGRSSPAAEPHRNAGHPPGGVQVAAALRVAIDPATRQRMLPAPAQSSELSARLQDALSRSGEGLTVVQRPDGTQFVDLQGRFGCGLVAGGVAGSKREACVASPQAAETARHGADTVAHREVQ